MNEARCGALPTMAVVTPSFNQGRWLRSAIDSVLDEAYPGLDYLVVDAVSNDDSCDIARSYGQQLRLLCEPDRGQSDGINKGFRHTRGEIIAWLNADDVYLPGALSKVGRIFAEHPDVGLVYGNAEFVDEAGSLIGPAVHVEAYSRERLLGVGDLIVQPAAFFRRSLFEAVGGLREDLHWTMDYDLWLRLGQLARVVYVDDVLAQVRCHAGAKTFSGGGRRLQEVEMMIREHGGRALPAYFQIEAAAMALDEGLRQLAAGRFLKASRSLAKAALIPLASLSTMAVLAQPQTWRVINAARSRTARLAQSAASAQE